MRRVGLFLLLLWSIETLGAPPVKLSVFGVAKDHTTAKIAADLNNYFEVYLKANPKLAVININKLLDVSEDYRVTNSLNTAKQAYLDGVRAYNNLQLKVALEKLSQAEKLFIDNFGFLSPDHLSTYINTLLYLGATHIVSGSKRQGEAYFKKALLFKADLVFDSDRVFPPSMRINFKNAQDFVSLSKLGSIMINTTPENVAISVDGKYYGISPVFVKGLKEGNHIVSCKKIGYGSKSQEITIAPYVMRSVKIQLRRTIRYLVFEEIYQKIEKRIDLELTPQAVGELGKFLMAEALIFVTIVPSPAGYTLSAHVFDLRIQRRLPVILKTLPANYAENPLLIKNFINSVIQKADFDGTIYYDPNRIIAAELEGKTKVKEPFYRKWWFWTVVGLVVAGGLSVMTYYLVDGALTPSTPSTRENMGSISIKF